MGDVQQRSGIIDTYSEFLSYWDEYGDRGLKEQIGGWEEVYLSKWPELLRKQILDYEEMSLDWRRVAEDRVFPGLEERFEDMNRVRALLSVIIPKIHSAAEETFERELNITYVIYVGIGCGAGWVTEYEGGIAVLLGLEMIAENGWTDEETLQGLLSHELGHAVHGILRREAGLSDGSGPFWQLYSEGFAQRCGHMILQKDTWHVGIGQDEPDWLNWCSDNRIWLAGKFLQAVDSGEDIRPFFGSWFDIKGRKHCGQYLGHDVIANLQRSSDIGNIALIEEVDEVVKRVLKEMITEG